MGTEFHSASLVVSDALLHNDEEKVHFVLFT